MGDRRQLRRGVGREDLARISTGWRRAGYSAAIRITNYHVHTFTQAHVPSRFLPWGLRHLIRVKALRRGVVKLVRSYYPRSTRFVVLPMDMEHMGAGTVSKSVDQQHDELAALAESEPLRGILVPFAAADPRHPDMLEKTTRRLTDEGFRGIKLYPPIGYPPKRCRPKAPVRPRGRIRHTGHEPLLAAGQRPVPRQAHRKDANGS